jgi:inner membrane protein
MIESLIDERQSYRNEAVQQVSKSWAGAQTIGGAILTVIKRTEKISENGNKFTAEKSYHYLPENLNYTAEILPEKRKRGIYEVMLYTAKIKINGSINIEKLKEQFPDMDFDLSLLSINVNDLRGIQNDPKLFVNKNPFVLLPGLKNKDVYTNGLHSDILIDKNTSKLDFEIDLLVNGIDDLSFLPVGKTTTVNVKSKWNNPNFNGAYLPTTHNISKDGFNADWKINYFNRSFPQNWEGSTQQISSSAFGVKLLMPVDEYQKTMRTSKYGLMIIVLTFLSFFMIELFSKRAIHPIQYLLVGFALILFYSLLLAISEYVSFDYSYIISSLLVISLIGLYVKSIYNSNKIGSMIFGALIIFYGFMYIILQLQDYSLIAGNIALFTLLGLIMYLTRKFNWFDILSNKTKNINT